MTRADQVGVEDELAHPTVEQQPLLRAVFLCGLPALWADLARVVGIYQHRHAAGEQRFVGDVSPQLSEGSLRGMPGDAALLRTRLLPVLALPPSTDMGQILQAKEGVRGGVHNAPANPMVALLLHSSRSPCQHDQASCRRVVVSSCERFLSRA